MEEQNYCVYMLASKSHVLYIGMTNNLHRRVFEHKNDLIEGFSSQYRCHRLVYYESFDDVRKAINREKQLKRWSRAKKVWLIEQIRPGRIWLPIGTRGTAINQTKSRSLHSPADLLRKSADSVGMTVISDNDNRRRSRGTETWELRPDNEELTTDYSANDQRLILHAQTH